MSSQALRLAFVAALLAAPQAAQCVTEVVNGKYGWRRFGVDVAISGDRMLVGSPEANTSGLFFAGRVAAYERHDTGWELTQEISASPLTAYADFGSSVDVDGDRAVIGARGEELVFVFELVGSTWVQTQTLLPPPLAGWLFGAKVALDGDRLLVGEYGPSGSDGSVWAYERVGGLWVEKQQLTGGPTTRFGSDIALEGDLAVVGASGWYTGSIEAAHVFRFDGATWNEEAKLGPPVPGINEFGAAVAVSGDRLIVGDPEEGDGFAYLYENGPGGWQLAATLSPPLFSGDEFGRAVSIDGTRALVSCTDEVHVYELVGSSWVEVGGIEPDEHVFGDFGQALVQNGDCFLITSMDESGSVGWSAGTVLEGSFAETDCWTLASQQNFLFYDKPDFSTALLDLFPGPAHAGQIYAVLGSLSGLHPGTPILGAVLPLAPDGYLTWTLLHPGQAPLSGSLGVLDGNGEAQAVLSLADVAEPSLNGLLVHHAFLLLDPTTLQLVHVSNAVGLQLVQG